MPDDASLNPASDSAVINEISICAHKAIVSIQELHPELLNPGYRVAWSEPNYRSAFLAGLSKKISQGASRDTLVTKVKEYLGLFLLPSFFDTPTFSQLEQEIRQLTHPETENGASSAGSSASASGMAILLLDTENLQLDIDTEKILEQACHYPIQIKIAFAHWTSLAMRGQDAKFHSRNYQLIHVPAGENSADLQMTAYGSSILGRYPSVKEVLVCSSDQGLLHLCNELHDQGLIVYRVSRKGQIISIFNKRTEETITTIVKIDFDKFILQVKSLVKDDNRRHAKQWISSSKLSQLYQARYNLSLQDAISNYTNYQSDIEFFTENPHHFAVHQLPNQPELYISLFNPPVAYTSSNQKSLNHAKVIDSASALEQALIKILNSLNEGSPGSYVPLGMLGTKFSEQYGQKVTEAIERLQLKMNFLQFLQSCSSFKIEQKNGAWHVAIANL